MANLKSMQYFVRVAELGSFSKAADVLRLTQPAVSRQIQKLEAEIGLQLLYRKGRYVSPTEAGKMLMARSKDLDREVNRIFEDVRGAASQPAGPLAIGVATLIGNLLLPSVLKDFVGNFPQVRVHVLEGYSLVVEEWLQEGRIDIGLIWGNPRSAAIDLTPMMAVKMCLIAPPSPINPWESAKPLGATCTMREVVRLPLILPALPHAMRLLAESAAKKAGMPIKIAFEIDGLPLATELVRDGLGYTLMTHSGQIDNTGNKHVRSIPVRSPEVLWVLSFATLKGTRVTPAISEFMRCVINSCTAKINTGELLGTMVKRKE